MKPLTSQNIESELSYAYIHAVAACAGVGCKIGSRHDDNAGVDAELTGWGPFEGGGYIQEVDIKVQLKATIKPRKLTPQAQGYVYSFSGIPQYDDLRTEAVSIPRILVVLFLPADQSQWLTHAEDALTLRNCAYWVSLRGADASQNQTSQTVHLPRQQCFDPLGLRALMSRLSRNDVPIYDGYLP